MADILQKDPDLRPDVDELLHERIPKVLVHMHVLVTSFLAKIMNNIELIMLLPFQLLGLFQLMKRFEDTSEDELGSSIEQNRKTKRR